MKIFDSHLHIIDPRFPLTANNGYLPEPFPADQYLATSKTLGICAGAVVSGSFQQFDQQYLLAALATLGPGFVGVTQLPANVSDATLVELDQAGVRAVRFNLYRGGSESVSALKEMAARIHDLLGWHVELYIDSRDLAELYPLLSTLPAVSIDHLGMHADGLTDLLRLAACGVHIKATGFGRVELDVVDTIQQILNTNPDVLMFGTDLPSTRARRPFSTDDIRLLEQIIEPAFLGKVMYDNAARFYRLPAQMFTQPPGD
jgi:predicted TIM-barrel fold metal-dependent hydrolase